MKKVVKSFQIAVLIFWLSIVFCGNSLTAAGTTGPAKGTLIIAGGALKDKNVYLKMLELAGGPDARLVIIPTAGPDNFLKRKNYKELVKRDFIEYGFKNITVLHTRFREEAETEIFVKPLLKATCVWFTGGRQWRLADSYLDTRTHRELENLLKHGGVIGGSSAGATIQGSYLARGDTQANTIMMGDHVRGLAFLKNVAIDQHLLARNRQFDLFEIINKHPHLLGIGLDENTAILVRGNQFEVIGKSYVAIYDGSFWSAERNSISPLPQGTAKFYMLKAGMRYNLEKRSVIQPITAPLWPLLDKKGIDAVIKKFQQLRHQPDRYFMDERITNSYGNMLLKGKKYKEAIEIFKLNAEKYPDSANVYDSLGEAYMKNGDKKQAALNFIKSLEINPNNKNALEKLKTLYKE